MAELNNTGTGQWSETDANNTSVVPDGWPSGTFFNQVEPIGRSTMGAIKRFWDRINFQVTTSGSSNAYVYTPANVSYPTALVAGEVYGFKPNFSNTGATTLALNGLTATPIYKQSSTGPIALVGGEITANQYAWVIYDGTHFQLMNNPSVVSTSGFLQTANNLSDVSNTATALTNIGAVSSATVAATYLTQSNAASTYLTQSNATTTYAPLVSPTFTGSPVLPTATTAVTQSSSDNSTKLATTAYVKSQTSPLMTALGVGSVILATYTGSSLSAGATTGTAGMAVITAGGSATSDVISGTWRTLQSLSSGQGGLFQRIS